MPPSITRCSYLPENFFAYELASGWGAPLASPSSVIVGTAMTGAAASRFQIVVFCLALSEAEPPPVIVDHDTDVIGIVEGRSAALEGGIIELPFR